MQQNPVFSQLSLNIGQLFTTCTLSKLISKVYPQFTFFSKKMIPEFQKKLGTAIYNKNDLIKNNTYKCTAVSFKLFKDRAYH